MKTATDTMEKPATRISASEYAREKLHLLEKVQGNATWHTSIVAESQEDIALLQEVQKELTSKHYATTMTVDAWNRPVLEIEHIGHQSGLVESFEKLGAIKGLQVTTEKIQDGIGNALTGTKNFFDSPVKFLSGFYLLADALFTASGFVEKDASGENVTGAAKWLKSSTGLFSAMQSFIFLHYGEDGNKHQLANIERHVNHALQQGDNPLSFLQDDSQLGNHTHPVASALLDNPVARFVTDNKFLRDHPITAGAASWIMGQSALFASAMIRLNDINNNPHVDGEDKAKALQSVWADAKRAVWSITGWLILTMDQKHTEEKTPITQNPIKWTIEHIQESPQVYSGLIALRASVVGIEGGNPLMQAAEISNITGDMAMFFTKKSEYGGESFGDPKVLAEALAGFVERSPILLSPATEQALIAEMANYFAEKTVEQAQQKGKSIPADFASSVYNHTLSELAGKPRGIDKVAFHLAEITAHFPEAQQPSVRRHLVETISQFPAVMVDAQELENQVIKAQGKLAAGVEQSASPPTMTGIADKLAELTFALPAIHASDHASRLFDVVQQHVANPSANQNIIFEHALLQKVAEDVGISLQHLQQMMQQAGGMQQHEITAAQK